MKDEERLYEHLLTYDQDVFDGILYGEIDLYFEIRDNTLFIKRVEDSKEKTVETSFTLKDTMTSVINILEDFLVNYMSYSKNFVGYPVYCKSNLFSKDTFDELLKKAIVKLHNRNSEYEELGKSNELINFCRSINLNPTPEGTEATIWLANCLSGGGHRLLISTQTNEWACGYCGKKGDLEMLKDWYKSKSN